MHELRHYLEMLLDHECKAGSGECPECKSLQRIYQFIQTELFSTVIYAERALDSRQPAKGRGPSVNRAGAGPRRPPTD